MWYQHTGSCLNLNHGLAPDAAPLAVGLLGDVFDAWCAVVAGAAPLPDEADAAAVAARVHQLFEVAWKLADRGGVAFGVMAPVLGDAVADGLFDVIFGPAASWQDFDTPQVASAAG